MEKIEKMIKKIALGTLVVFFALSNVSCRAQDVTPSTKAVEAKAAAQPVEKTAPKPVEVPKPVEAPKEEVAVTDASADELVYLKVASAKASSFDASPDWAPRPDAMAPFDGNMETRWASGYEDEQWLVFDFGKEKTVTQLIVKWEQAYATSFEILTSNDGEEWTSLAFLENQAGGTTTIDAGPATCRYVKLVSLGRVNEDWGISIWEIEAYGPKAMNPDDKPLEESFEIVGKTSYVKKAEELRAKITPGFIAPSPGPITTEEFQKGVNYTSWNNDELLTLMSDSSLAYLAEVGVGHIGLMVVHYMEDAVQKSIYIEETKTISDEALGHAINMMHLLGMKVMLKPHVDLADEDSRTNIFPTDEWFVAYKAMVLHYAQIAQKYNVELYCVGTELTNTAILTWKEEWLDIISEIRKVYKGPLTYASNWDDYDTVCFWDEMDFVGMDAYFPLTENNKNPTKEILIKGWTTHANVLEKWLEDNGITKPIIFTEVGYDTMEGTNVQPWRVLPTLAKYKESQQEQSDCLEALFTVLSGRSWFKGFYWWNYFPRPDLGPMGYTLRGKMGEKVLSEWFEKLQ